MTVAENGKLYVALYEHTVRDERGKAQLCDILLGPHSGPRSPSSGASHLGQTPRGPLGAVKHHLSPGAGF